MKKAINYHVYSSMLGGFIATGFKTEEEAKAFIRDYHCPYEKKTMSVCKDGGAR